MATLPIKGTITLDQAIDRVNRLLTSSLNDEWSRLGDVLGVTWDDLKNAPHSPEIDDRILYLLKHWLACTKDHKIQKLSSAVTKLGKPGLAELLRAMTIKNPNEDEVAVQFSEILEGKLSVEWIALWVHLQIPWDPESGMEKTNVKLSEKLASGFDLCWLRDGKVDFEEKMIELSSVLEKINRTELVRSLPTEEAIYEDPLIISFEFGEANALQAHVLTKISTRGNQLKRKWLSVCSIDPLSAECPANATFVSDVIQFAPDETLQGQEFQDPLGIHIPYCFNQNTDEYELVMLEKEEGQESWKQCDYKIEEEGFLTLLKSELKRPFTLAAVGRLIVNEMTVSKEGGELRSTVEDKVVMEFPGGAYEGDNTVKMQVETTISKDNPFLGVKNVSGLSPVLYVESAEKSSKPIDVKVPIRSTDGTSFKGSYANLNLVMSAMDGPWEPLKVNAEFDSGVAKFSTGVPEDRSSFMVMKTDKPFDQEELKDLAEEVDEKLHAYTVLMIIRQNRVNPKKALIKLCETDKKDSVIAEMAARGYIKGPDFDSNEFRIKNKQKISCYFSDGHIDFSGGGKKTMTFNSALNSTQTNVYLEVKTKPPPADIYGTFKAELLDSNGDVSSEDINCTLLVELPEEPKPELSQITEEAIVNVFTNAKPELLLALGRMMSAEIPIVPDSSTDSSPRSSPYSTPCSTPPSSIATSSRRSSESSMASSKPSRAPTPRSEELKKREKERRTKIKTAVVVLKNHPSAQKAWQPLARELGLKDQDITTIIHDTSIPARKVVKTINKWNEAFGEKATVQRLIKCLKKVMLNDAARLLDSPYACPVFPH